MVNAGAIAITDMVPGTDLAVIGATLAKRGVGGLRVFEELSERFSLHVFDPEHPWQRPSRGSG